VYDQNNAIRRRATKAVPDTSSARFGLPTLYFEVEVRMRYKVALHRSEEGFAASVPGLPGCWSQGASEAEALENIRTAITEYLSIVDDQLRGEDVRVIEVAG
jgi:predicted RNase H-like HicB family nuclease